MNDVCGRCGAPADADAVTCDSCGALLAAYRPPAGAREAMPEPDFELAESARDDAAGPMLASRPEPESSCATRDTIEPPKGPELGPEQPSPRSSVHLDHPIDIRGEEEPVVATTPATVPTGRAPREATVEPAPAEARPARPARQTATAARPRAVSGSGRDKRVTNLFRITVVGSIAGILVACMLVFIGSSERVSDAYAYVGLCLGPLGLIGLLIAVGLAAINRTNGRS